MSIYHVSLMLPCLPIPSHLKVNPRLIKLIETDRPRKLELVRPPPLFFFLILHHLALLNLLVSLGPAPPLAL